MKMQQTSVIVSLLSIMPLLVVCKKNNRAMSIVRDALVASRPLTTTEAAFFDGTNKDKGKDSDASDLFHARVLRELQFTDACNATYNALWEDQALNETANTYSANYNEAIGSLANCMEGSNYSIKCTVDGPIEGETEYQSACTNAGGETMPISFDLSCTGTFEGNSTSVVVDVPPVLSCIPASADFDGCKDGLSDLYQNVTDLMALVYEFGLTVGGFSQVSCSAGDVGAGGSNGGSSNAATRGIGIFSVAMFGFSLFTVGGYH